MFIMDNNRVEYLSQESWQQWHTELLQSSVNRVYRRVPFYRKAMEASGIRPEDISSLADLAKLPFTTRKDLSDNYPYDLFAVPLRDIVRIHALRGMGPNPVVLGFTSQDIRHRQKLTTRFLTACGVSSDDIVQICMAPGMSVLGQEMKEGAETLGALVIPPDPLSAASQIKVLLDFKTTVLVSTPSYARHLLSLLKESGQSLARLALKKGIFVGEKLTSAFRQELKEQFAVDAYSGYSILEVMGPGMAFECGQGPGLHLSLDHFIPEIVDPGTGEALPPGETGELVVTTLTNRANPLLRFRTGDLTHLITENCPCGRTTWRMAPVEKRCDDLFSVLGVKISPVQVETFLKTHTKGTELPHIIVIKKRRYLKQIELWSALNPDIFTGCLPEIHDWIRSIENAFEEAIGVGCRVRPVELETISPYLHKNEKVVFLSN